MNLNFLQQNFKGDIKSDLKKTKSNNGEILKILKETRNTTRSEILYLPKLYKSLLLVKHKIYVNYYFF